MTAPRRRKASGKHVAAAESDDRSLGHDLRDQEIAFALDRRRREQALREMFMSIGPALLLGAIEVQ